MKSLASFLTREVLSSRQIADRIGKAKSYMILGDQRLRITGSFDNRLRCTSSEDDRYIYWRASASNYCALAKAVTQSSDLSLHLQSVDDCPKPVCVVESHGGRYYSQLHWSHFA